jgi:hypothetical protein
VAEWAFAGRADELGRLRDLVVRERCDVVVAGPSAVGKSRLASECLSTPADADDGIRPHAVA